MKILILQLARLGDIYQSWPAIRGLRRKYPQATIDVLTRPRFVAALDGLESINEKMVLPTQDLLSPLVQVEMDIKAAYAATSGYVDGLKTRNYDWIINFSFSPFSSYLSHSLTGLNTRVSGYTRHSDGFLSIPDDMSAYFYAQVGLDKPNRFHLAEIFATLAEVDLEASDWQAPKIPNNAVEACPIVIHIGASEAKKQVSPHKWASIINHLGKAQGAKRKVALIGAKSEEALAETILSSIPSDSAVSFVGKTSLSETFSLIQKAQVLVGPDSAPMHMASLTGTPCVNISLGNVNFWETGPRSAGSCILRAQDEADVASDRVTAVIEKVLKKEKQDLSVITVQEGTPCYRAFTPKGQEFEWRFLKAIYMGEEFPETDADLFFDGVEKLADINSLMIDQMIAIEKGGDLAKSAPIIDRGEEIIEAIGKLVPALAILVRWYQTEKIRQGPGEPQQILARSLEIQRTLQKVLDVYLPAKGDANELASVR